MPKCAVYDYKFSLIKTKCPNRNDFQKWNILSMSMYSIFLASHCFLILLYYYEKIVIINCNLLSKGRELWKINVNKENRK